MGGNYSVAIRRTNLGARCEGSRHAADAVDETCEMLSQTLPILAARWLHGKKSRMTLKPTRVYHNIPYLGIAKEAQNRYLSQQG